LETGNLPLALFYGFMGMLDAEKPFSDRLLLAFIETAIVDFEQLFNH
jgi:hypothetical protein